MAFSPFDAALGARQGRLQAMGPVQGPASHVYVLGSDLPGYSHQLAIGDYAEVRQEVDLTGMDLVRAYIRMRNAKELPAGVNWQVSMAVGGVKMASMIVAPGRSRARRDMAANVSKLGGLHTVGLRLELVVV